MRIFKPFFGAIMLIIAIIFIFSFIGSLSPSEFSKEMFGDDYLQISIASSVMLFALSVVFTLLALSNLFPQKMKEIKDNLHERYKKESKNKVDYDFSQINKENKYNISTSKTSSELTEEGLVMDEFDQEFEDDYSHEISRSNKTTTTDKVLELKKMLDDGLITKAEFDNLKSNELGSINIEQKSFVEQNSYFDNKSVHKKETKLTCIRCGSHNVNVQAISEVHGKNRGCLAWFFWIILSILTMGLFLILLLIINATKPKTTVHYRAICQSCGYNWKV